VFLYYSFLSLILWIDIIFVIYIFIVKSIFIFPLLTADFTVFESLKAEILKRNKFIVFFIKPVELWWLSSFCSGTANHSVEDTLSMDQKYLIGISF